MINTSVIQTHYYKGSANEVAKARTQNGLKPKCVFQFLSSG
jgi:hypothetical protein